MGDFQIIRLENLKFKGKWPHQITLKEEIFASDYLNSLLDFGFPTSFRFPYHI